MHRNKNNQKKMLKWVSSLSVHALNFKLKNYCLYKFDYKYNIISYNIFSVLVMYVYIFFRPQNHRLSHKVSHKVYTYLG